MKTMRRAISCNLIATALVVGAAGCSDKFLEVTNPTVIDASTVDLLASAAKLAASTQQDFATAAGLLIEYGGFMAGETYIMETASFGNEFGYRNVSDQNTTLTTMWAAMSSAAASGKLLLDLTLPSPATNINFARGATFRGYAILFLATSFCTGALAAGPELTANQMLDSAIFWLGKAIDVGKANGNADGTSLANTALVGRARAKLQKGDNAGALADANAVPAGFNLNLTYTDDLANRARLSNQLRQHTVDRSIVNVPPYYRTTDPRVMWLPPDRHPYKAFDGAAGPLFIQVKYPAYGSPIRLASKLEAEYIAAEASGGVNQQLALINRQRLAFGYPAYSGPADAASVLLELFNQKAFDFWLEGKRFGDYRRQPVAAATYVPVAGTPYWRPNYPPIGSQNCFPLPRSERDNNPHMTRP